MVIEKVVPVSSTKVAEMTKLLENIHRAVNVGLVNEMKIICEKMGIDIYEVIHAASTKPFGFVPYFPGPGLGGHCIPIDPFYLTWKAKEYGVNTKFIELAGEINSSMPHYVIARTAEALNNVEKSVKGSKILVLGIAYKKNVDDTRESPSIEIIHLLKGMGAKVDYSDPFAPTFPKKRDYDLDMKSVELTAATLATYDCVLVSTNHDKFDYELINKHSKMIIDTRGVYKTSDRIIRA
jgi:UDP-N-acetyl-D-glucosamine dehydrogenase